jgi:hypothetical protein
MAEQSLKIFYISTVIDNEDTFLLGRVRCLPQDWPIKSILNDLDSDGLLNQNKSDVADKYKFTSKDPFVFMPLLPPYMSFIPKPGESVWLMYTDAKDNWGKKEQFYTVVTKTNPFNIVYEDNGQSKALTNLGSNLVPGKEFKSTVINSDEIKGTNYNYPQKSYKQPIQGIFAEPCDNAIYGQGTSDIILKKDSVLLRAGKVNEMSPNTITEANRERGFLQISYFKSRKIESEPTTTIVDRVDESPLRKLLEYNITNLENQFERFRGEIRIYDIAEKYNIKNNEFTAETPIDPKYPTPLITVRFENQPMSSVTDTINYMIEGLNKEKIEPREGPIPITGRTITNCFPFYYRPSANITTTLKTVPDFSQGVAAFYTIQNAQRLISNVRFTRNFSLEITGDGLVSRKNKAGTSMISEIKKIDGESEYVNNKTSVSILGSNKILLISQDSQIPGAGKIVMDTVSNSDQNTIYGFSDKQIFDDIIPNTEPLVRGYKLKELLNLIVRFLVSHSHPYHQLPPSSDSYGGVGTDDIESEFQNYDENVLSQNIRIN